MVKAADRFERRRRRVRYALKDSGNGPAAAVRVPLGPPHLRPGDRRRAGARRWPPPRPWTRACATTLKTGADREAARRVGLLLAERAKEAGVEAVMFDRGGYKYHGRVKALADGAREGGLQF